MKDTKEPATVDPTPGDGADNRESDGGSKEDARGGEKPAAVFKNKVVAPIRDGIKRSFEKMSTKSSVSEDEGSGAFSEMMTSAEAFVDKAVAPLKERFEKRKKSGTSTSNDEAEEPRESRNLSAVPPDTVLQTMELIIRKRLTGISVQDFYDVCWSEGNNTDKDPFYGPWLISSGKNDVHVEDWKFVSDDGEEFVGSWCGEKYSQKRIVKFRFTRTTHLYTGPPVADVKHTQYCRLEGNDKCVVQMTIEMEGIPFADCFNVEIRWVAKRIGTKDISVQVGLFVNFVKQTMLASKIRSGTSAETKKAQQSLFEHMKEAISKFTGEELVEEEEEEGTPTSLQPAQGYGTYLFQFFSELYKMIFSFFGFTSVEAIRESS